MTYRTSHMIKTLICMIIAGVLMIYGFMVIIDKIYETSNPAVINISAKSLKIEKGVLYLPVINGNGRIYELVEETNNTIINFVNNIGPSIKVITTDNSGIINLKILVINPRIIP